MNIIRLYSHSGLCNRLRLFTSYRNMSQAEDKDIEFHWINCVQCWAKYSELFYPISGVDFIYKKHLKNPRKSRPANSVATMNLIKRTNESVCNKDHVLPLSLEEYQKYLLDIVPLEQIGLEILKIRSQLNGDYNACHVRRTDIITMQNKYKVDPPSDEYFFDFVESSDKKVFIATDNLATQKIFKDKFGEKVFTYSQMIGNGDKRWPYRMTDIQSAVVDLFTCIYAKRFIGTNLSSFTDFIEDYRQGIINEQP